jgi:hypothetical protein
VGSRFFAILPILLALALQPFFLWLWRSGRFDFLLPYYFRHFSRFFLGAGRSRLSGSAVEGVPSTSFGTLVVSMYLGQCINILIFLPFSAAEMAEVAVFLFFPYFHEG